MTLTRSPDQFRPGATASVATPTCCSCCCCCVGTAVGFTVALPLAVARLSPDPAQPRPTGHRRAWGLVLLLLAPVLALLVAVVVQVLLVERTNVADWLTLLLGAGTWAGCLAAGLRLTHARPRAVGVAVLLLVLAGLVAVVELGAGMALLDADRPGTYALAAVGCFVTMVALGWLLSWNRSSRVPPDGPAEPSGPARSS